MLDDTFEKLNIPSKDFTLSLPDRAMTVAEYNSTFPNLPIRGNPPDHFVVHWEKDGTMKMWCDDWESFSKKRK